MASGPATEPDGRRSLIGTLALRARQVTSGADRRKHGRLKGGDTLSSNVGTVRDLSAGGMRIIGRRKLKGTVEVTLWDIRRGLRVTAEVVWRRRIGFRRHETGLRFLEIGPDMARELTALGADNRSQFV